METLQVLGGRLRELRKEKKLKQRELAAFLDITEVHYRRVEAGKINIPTLTLCALADYYGVTTDYLLGLRSSVEAFRLQPYYRTEF